MAVRRRSRFAAPLVITVAACSKTEPPKPPAYSGMSWDVRMVGGKGCRADEVFRECPPEGDCNPPPPRAVECPPGSSGRTLIRVAELPDKTCGILPAGCFDASCVKLKAPCPLPAGQTLRDTFVEVWTIEKRAAGCHAEEAEHDCPPGVDCNPPQPRMIPCPAGITEDTNLRVAPLRDGTCVIVPPGCDEPSCATAKTPCPTR
jgi:hypothetical protein